MTLPEIERLSEGSIIARRNRLIGTWAGMRLGYRADRLSHYVNDIMDIDFLVPGPSDIIDKITADFKHNKVDLPPDLIVLELERIERNLRNEQLV